MHERIAINLEKSVCWSHFFYRARGFNYLFTVVIHQQNMNVVYILICFEYFNATLFFIVRKNVPLIKLDSQFIHSHRNFKVHDSISFESISCENFISKIYALVDYFDSFFYSLLLQWILSILHELFVVNVYRFLVVIPFLW